MALSSKQREYIANAGHRWNIKTGATRSGKTYLDYAYMIPKRVLACTGAGLIVLLGNTQGSTSRNVLEPMRNLWGEKWVSSIRKGDNTVQLFGRKTYVLGADKANSVSKIQGAGIEYCYGDEVTTWAEPVFQMLKSRLDKPNSTFDGTCNPDNPQHWFKQFLDSDADIYKQAYTIDDNPFLPAKFVADLKAEYAGTVFYDRYILGKWTRAEGAIYRCFLDNEAAHMVQKDDLPKRFDRIHIGQDIGGNKSQHAFCAVGITTKGNRYDMLYVLKSQCLPAKDVSVERIMHELSIFAETIASEYGPIDSIFVDSAEQAIIASERQNLPYTIRNSVKNEINDRIRAACILMGVRRMKFVTGENDVLLDGLRDASWDEKRHVDKRLDDGTTNIDILDAFEYAWETYIPSLLRER